MGLNIRHTTIIGVRRNGRVAMGSDGQVTLGETILKHSARKVRKICDGKVIVGFAGATADALTLFERFETKLEEFAGNLPRAVVELAKDWRTDRVLRRLEALLGIMDQKYSFVVSGAGDVIEPDDGVVAIGSGGAYALIAARLLLKHTSLPADEIVREAITEASNVCVYTNKEIFIETI